jgi:hypothetical protein
LRIMRDVYASTFGTFLYKGHILRKIILCIL